MQRFLTQLFVLIFLYGFLFDFSVGRPKHVRVMAGALEGDTFIGPKAEEHRGLLSIRYPMEVSTRVTLTLTKYLVTFPT